MNRLERFLDWVFDGLFGNPEAERDAALERVLEAAKAWRESPQGKAIAKLTEDWPGGQAPPGQEIVFHPDGRVTKGDKVVGRHTMPL